MVTLREPSSATVRSFLESQATRPLTYSAIGATAGVPPSGYRIDHTRIRLGKGEICFNSAKLALENWQQFPTEWAKTFCLEQPLRTGTTVAVVARTLGLWWLNACRITYIVDELASSKVFAIAMGTLHEHAGTGEERFLVEWNRADDSVWYDILAFSRPHGLLARFGYLWFRHVQNKFRQDSAAAMLKVVRTRP